MAIRKRVNNPFDPFENVEGWVRECWKCGEEYTHDDDCLLRCRVCRGKLVPYGQRFVSGAKGEGNLNG